MNVHRAGRRIGTLCVYLLLTLFASVRGAAAAASGDARVYPQGKVFPFMGYSGAPHRDAKFGFSVAGPSYSTDQGGVTRSPCYAACLSDNRRG